MAWWSKARSEGAIEVSRQENGRSLADDTAYGAGAAARHSPTSDVFLKGNAQLEERSAAGSGETTPFTPTGAMLERRQLTSLSGEANTWLSEQSRGGSDIAATGATF